MKYVCSPFLKSHLLYTFTKTTSSQNGAYCPTLRPQEITFSPPQKKKITADCYFLYKGMNIFSRYTYIFLPVNCFCAQIPWLFINVTSLWTRIFVTSHTKNMYVHKKIILMDNAFSFRKQYMHHVPKHFNVENLASFIVHVAVPTQLS